MLSFSLDSPDFLRRVIATVVDVSNFDFDEFYDFYNRRYSSLRITPFENPVDAINSDLIISSSPYPHVSTSLMLY